MTTSVDVPSCCESVRVVYDSQGNILEYAVDIFCLTCEVRNMISHWKQINWIKWFSLDSTLLQMSFPKTPQPWDSEWGRYQVNSVKERSITCYSQLYYVRVRLESEGKIATIKKRGRDLVEEMKLQTEEVLETTRIMLQKNMKDQVRWWR